LELRKAHLKAQIRAVSDGYTDYGYI